MKGSKGRYLPLNVLLITVAGLYAHKNTNKFYLKMYKLYTAVCIIICILTSFWIIAGLAIRETLAFIDVAGTVLHFSIYITTFYLLLYFYINRDHLERIFTFMEEDFVYFSEPEICKLSMFQYINGSKWLTVIWLCWTPFAVLTVTLVPVINGRLPFLVWCFYDCNTSPVFQIAVFLQLLGQSIIAAVFLATDTLFPCFAYVGVGQFRILACNYKNIFNTVLLKLGVHVEDVSLYSKSFENNGVETAMIKNINSLIKSPEFSKIIFKIFTEYVERHQKLLKYIEDVDNFFSNYFIVKIGTYVAYVVVILYLMLLGTDTTLAFLLCTYFLGSIVPTFLFCYFGQLFVDEYNSISLSLYESPWYVGSQKFQKTFLFVHLAVSRPIKLTAGKIIDMNIETFERFIKLLISFATFIRNMGEKE